jgi:hypothetical protein
MIKIIRHNAGICVASMVCVLLLLWTYGCESKVLSPVTGKSVTYAELALDISAESKRIEGELDLLTNKLNYSSQSLNVKRKSNANFTILLLLLPKIMPLIRLVLLRLSAVF